MPKSPLRALAALLALLIVAAPAGLTRAQESRPSQPATAMRRLVIGTKEAPPFAMKGADGAWTGISIDLWREIASDIGVDFDLKETDLAGLVQGLRDGTLDASVAALSVTAEREEQIDFSHPFYTTGLGIAVATRQAGGGVLSTARRVFSKGFLQVVLGLGCMLLLAGLAIWFFERRANKEQFGGTMAEGVEEGFWFAAVTMTTVGYGDKSPKTRGGRLVALIWMFSSVVMISSFTATIASMLTVSQLELAVHGPEDLPRVRVASVLDTTSGRYLEAHHVAYMKYASLADALRAVDKGNADAAVYDAPILTYEANTLLPGKLTVLPQTFERQDYAIGLPEQSALRKAINQALLKRLAGPTWKDIRYRYLGE